MKLISALLLTLASLTFTAFADELNDYRAGILFNRVENVLKYRYQAMVACSRRLRLADLAAHSQVIGAALKNSLPPSEQNLLLFMALLQRSDKRWNLPGLCRSDFIKSNHEIADLERGKFKLASAVGLGFLLDSVEPHCALEVAKDRGGSFETNPCFAGDNLVSKTLWLEDGIGASAPKNDVPKLMDSFLRNFYDAIDRSPDNAALDYWRFYEAKDRKLFLGIMAFFMASSSSNSGYVDGFGDFIWRDALRRGKAPEDALAQYHAMKKKKDLFRDLLAWTRKKRQRLVLLSIADLTGANRHDMMAAYLACHYSAFLRESEAEAIPQLLGNGYEGLDFLSHLKKRVGLRRSMRNFREDTGRYRTSSRWGYAFCE